MRRLTITICGCGNGAHAGAALMREQGHIVNIYSPLTREIEQFRANYEKNDGLTMRFGPGLLSATGDDNAVYGDDVKTVEHIEFNRITDKAEEVIPGSSLIFVVVPSFAHKNMLRHIGPYLDKNSVMVFLPSRGGLEFDVEAITPGAKVMAFQTLPWACRIKKFGSEILISGRKESIMAASMPGDLSEVFFSQLESILEMRIERIKDILTMTVANMGQVIHPGIMYCINRKDPFKVYTEDNLPLFYQGVDAEGADVLMRMSEEVIEVTKALQAVRPTVEADKVKRIDEWLLASYSEQIADKSALWRMLCTNKAYDGLKAPVKKTEDGKFVVDYSYRYIVEDVPYSLLPTKSIAMMLGVETPTIDMVLEAIDEWTGSNYLGRLKDLKTFSNHARVPELYGITAANELF